MERKHKDTKSSKPWVYSIYKRDIDSQADQSNSCSQQPLSKNVQNSIPIKSRKSAFSILFKTKPEPETANDIAEQNYKCQSIGIPSDSKSKEKSKHHEKQLQDSKDLTEIFFLRLKQTDESQGYEVNDIIFAKCLGQPLWPCKITSIERVPGMIPQEIIHVKFFNENMSSIVTELQILSYSLDRSEQLKKLTKNRQLLKALTLSDKAFIKKKEKNIDKEKNDRKKQLNGKFQNNRQEQSICLSQNSQQSSYRISESQRGFYSLTLNVSEIHKNKKKRNFKPFQPKVIHEPQIQILKPQGLVITTPKIPKNMYVAEFQMKMKFQHKQKHLSDQDQTYPQGNQQDQTILEANKLTQFSQDLQKSKKKIYLTKNPNLSKRKKVKKIMIESQQPLQRQCAAQSMNFQRQQRVLGYLNEYISQIQRVKPIGNREKKQREIVNFFKQKLNFKQLQSLFYRCILERSIFVVNQLSRDKQHEKFRMNLKKQLCRLRELSKVMQPKKLMRNLYGKEKYEYLTHQLQKLN